MHYLGEDGYHRVFAGQRDIKQRLIKGIEKIEGLEIIANPHALHFFFDSKLFDIFAVETGMAAMGWSAVRAEQPNSIMLWGNKSHQNVVKEYLADLQTVVENVRAGRLVAAENSVVYVT